MFWNLFGTRTTEKGLPWQDAGYPDQTNIFKKYFYNVIHITISLINDLWSRVWMNIISRTTAIYMISTIKKLIFFQWIGFGTTKKVLWLGFKLIVFEAFGKYHTPVI